MKNYGTMAPIEIAQLKKMETHPKYVEMLKDLRKVKDQSFSYPPEGFEARQSVFDTADLICENASTMVPFIFHDLPLDPRGETEILSLPFPLCSVEIKGRRWLYHCEEPDLKAKRHVISAVLFEDTPGHAKIMEYSLYLHQDGTMNLGVYANTFDELDKQQKQVYCGIFDFARLCQQGHEKTQVHIPHQNKKTKVTVNNVISRVVHLKARPKKLESSVEVLGGGRKVQWSHRWEVMGHWRRIEGVGKDRIGTYGVTGLTWVIPHERGLECNNLVKKVRIVDGT